MPTAAFRKPAHDTDQRTETLWRLSSSLQPTISTCDCRRGSPADGYPSTSRFSGQRRSRPGQDAHSSHARRKGTGPPL